MTDEPIDFIDIPPASPPTPIDELHVWVGVHADGAEALLSADMDR